MARRLKERVQEWIANRDGDRAQGKRYLEAGNYLAAVDSFNRAVARSGETGRSLPKRVRLLLQLAEAQRRSAAQIDPAQDSSRLAEAEVTLRMAIELAAKVYDRVSYVRCVDELADVFFLRRNYWAVEKLMIEAIRLGAAMPHPDPIRMAQRARRLGSARHRSGRPEEAIPSLELALSAYENLYGRDHAETADLLSETGSVYRLLRQHDRANLYLRRALQIHECLLGPEHPRTAEDLKQLAGSLEDSGDIDASAAQYERALKLIERKPGARDLDQFAEMQFGLAGLYIGWGNDPRARELLMECVGLFRKSGGARLAVTHEFLAQLEERSARFRDAIRELESAGKAWEACPGRAREQAGNLLYRAELLDRMQRKREAGWLRDRAERLLAKCRTEGTKIGVA